MVQVEAVLGLDLSRDQRWQILQIAYTVVWWHDFMFNETIPFYGQKYNQLLVFTLIR